ncbi:hypothetical protein JB92DRAFT_2930646 [Gautieria morchelliformis]|nr:hypothetical protein JB92DRAFT_2930646 [Gautieria morchelliformis]
MSTIATNCSLNSTIFQYDGDVAGVGVRLSFYFQNFFLVLLVDRSYEDAENALWTFIATSFGLTVAALVQVGLGNLNFVEGILASQLAWLANLGTFLALASYSRSKGKDNLIKVAAVLQGYFSMILTIVMWTWCAHFSQRSPCNHEIKFTFLFGVDLPALGAGRTVALVCASLMMALYTGVTLTECMAWRRNRMSRLSVRDTVGREVDVELSPRVVHKGSIISGHHQRKNSAMSQSRRRHPSGPSRQQWLGTDVDPIFLGIFLTQVIIFAYFISTTEKIVNQKHVHVSGTNQWGFGQVLALVVVIPSVISLVRAMRRNRIANLKEKEKKQKEASLKVPASPRGLGTPDSTTFNPAARPQLSLTIIPPSSSLEPGSGTSFASEFTSANQLSRQDLSSSISNL